MILDMKVPSPGESISEVEIATWLVSTVDYVEKDQAIAEVTLEQANSALRRHLKPETFVIGVGGDFK
jgi:2-oxoglutarate dehydrogenase E2 component (dihydrolipoamide succinyltransferase)